MPFSIYTLLFSLFAGSFGITKFFVKGPVPVLPQDAPLAGVLSLKFLTLLLLNTMFVVRTFCLEASFFSTYHYFPILKKRSIENVYTTTDIDLRIDPLIPEEYRLVVYLFPGFLSFIINLIRLSFTMKPRAFRYFKKFPQFILCPMFCPLMFEGNPDQRDDNEPPIRVWRRGSILNSFFMGSLSQVLLLALDHYKGVTAWNFGAKDYDGTPEEDNNALIKHRHGNTIFSITTFVLYLFLTIIFFGWEKIFNENGLLYRLCKHVCTPFLNPFNNPTSEETNPSAMCIQEDPEKVNELSIKDQTSVGTNIDKEEEGEHAEVLIFGQRFYILALFY